MISTQVDWDAVKHRGSLELLVPMLLSLMSRSGSLDQREFYHFLLKFCHDRKETSDESNKQQCGDNKQILINFAT